MAAELSKENYHDSDKIRMRERELLDKWSQLLAALEARRRALLSLSDLMGLLRDIDTLSSEIRALEVRFICHESFFSCMIIACRNFSIEKFFLLLKSGT